MVRGVCVFVCAFFLCLTTRLAGARPLRGKRIGYVSNSSLFFFLLLLLLRLFLVLVNTNFALLPLSTCCLLSFVASLAGWCFLLYFFRLKLFSFSTVSHKAWGTSPRHCCSSFGGHFSHKWVIHMHAFLALMFPVAFLSILSAFLFCSLQIFILLVHAHTHTHTHTAGSFPACTDRLQTLLLCNSHL